MKKLILYYYNTNIRKYIIHTLFWLLFMPSTSQKRRRRRYITKQVIIPTQPYQLNKNDPERCFLCFGEDDLYCAKLCCGHTFYHKQCFSEYCKKCGYKCIICSKNISTKLQKTYWYTVNWNLSSKLIYTPICIILYVTNATYLYSVIPNIDYYGFICLLSYIFNLCFCQFTSNVYNTTHRLQSTIISNIKTVLEYALVLTLFIPVITRVLYHILLFANLSVPLSENFISALLVLFPNGINTIVVFADIIYNFDNLIETSYENIVLKIYIYEPIQQHLCEY